MGVEQVFIDYFTRAKEYDVIKKSGAPYQERFEMETLAEILNGERFISLSLICSIRNKYVDESCRKI